MKFLYLLLIAISVSIFAAPKNSVEVPIVTQEEIPNIRGKIISIDKSKNSFVVSIEKQEVTILVTSKTYIEYIGKTIRKISFKDIAVDVYVSINSKDLFKDLERSKLSNKKVYTANFLSFSK